MTSTPLPPELTDESLDGFNQHGLTENDAPMKKRSKKSGAMIFKTMFVLTNVALMGYVAFTVFRPDDARLSKIAEQVTVNTNDIQQVSGEVKATGEKQLDFSNAIANLRSYIDELINNESDKLVLSSERVDAIELRLSAIEREWIAFQKTTDKKKQVAAKTPPKAPTKSPAVQPVSLVSIRSQGNYGMVNLANRSGDISPLLRNGDQWEGWKFIRLEGRKAVFEVAGRERQLTL